jgi:hypothetical protein
MKSKNPKNQSKIRFSHPNLEKVNWTSIHATISVKVAQKL